MLASLVRATEEGSRRALSEACTYLIPSSVGVPLDPYSHAVACETTIYVAGQVALDADNTMVGVGGPLRQAEQVWENIERVVEPAGGRVTDVVEIIVFLKAIRFGDAEIERFAAVCSQSDASPSAPRCSSRTWRRPRFSWR